jgi:hypothetical protein
MASHQARISDRLPPAIPAAAVRGTCLFPVEGGINAPQLRALGGICILRGGCRAVQP